MKKLMMIAAMAAATLFVAGCKNPPTPEVMYATAYVCGQAAGTVSDQIGMDKEVRQTVCDVMNIVSQVVPEVGQTFEEAWTPVANVHIDKLVADGKLTAAQAALVKSAFTLAVKGIDYVFIRHPEAKKVENLVVAAIDGFTKGFLETFKPENCTDCCIDCCERTRRNPVYRDCFSYLKGYAK